MTHFVETGIGALEILAEYPEKWPLADGGFTTVFMVQVRDSKGHVTVMPRSNLDVISRRHTGGGYGGTGPGESGLEWTADLGLTAKGAKDLHMAPETVGSLYKKSKKPERQE